MSDLNETQREQLLLLWSGELSGAERAAVELWMHDHPAARNYLRELRTLESLADDLPMGPQGRASLSGATRGSGKLKLAPWAAVALAAAACLLFSILILRAWPSSEPRAPHSPLASMSPETWAGEPPRASEVLMLRRGMTARSSETRVRRRQLASHGRSSLLPKTQGAPEGALP